VHAATEAAEDIDAARRADGLINRLFLDAVNARPVPVECARGHRGRVRLGVRA
jgi:hypothetical protein